MYVGDMDSIKGNVMCPNIIKLPRQKDDTDVMHAVKVAESKHANEIILFGVTGGRIDHTFGNLCVLKYLSEQKIKHKIIDENCEIIMACNEILSFENSVGTLVSVFPFGSSSCTVTYDGMAYPANSKTLHSNEPVGISNSVNSLHASISIESGTAFIVIYK